MAEDIADIEAKEKDPRETSAYWAKWIEAAKKIAKTKHWTHAKKAWAEYEHETDIQRRNRELEEDITQSYPIYHFSCKILEPALYARTPKGVTERRFNTNDAVGRTMSQIVERLDDYLTETNEFDFVIQKTVQEFIHADKAAPQVCVEQIEEKHLIPLTYADNMDVFVTPDGQPWAGEVETDEKSGNVFGVQRMTEIEVKLKPLTFDEVLHTPSAKTECEIKEKAYFFCLTRNEAEKRFGKERIANVAKWKRAVEREKDDYVRDDIDEKSDELYLEGWEIFYYQGHEKKVCWYSDQYPDDLLDVKDDPYKLKGFFPSPAFIISSPPRKHLYPKPVFAYIESLINELHAGQEKIFDLLTAIERFAVVSPELEDVVDQLKGARTGDYFVAKNYQGIVEKGGLRQLMEWVPVQELVSAISELSTLEDKFKNQFFEWFGVPDILRGTSDPGETLGAQQIKQGAAYDRFKFIKRLVQKMVRDTKEMMLDLALAVFPDEKIARIIGLQFLDPEDQQRFQSALIALRDDKSRAVRIDIETDSMNFVDEQMRFEQSQAVAQTVMSGLSAIAQAAKEDLGYGVLGLKILLSTLEHMPGGKAFQDEVKQTVEQFIEKLSQPQEPQPNIDQRLKEYELTLKNYQDNIDNSLQQFMAQLESRRVANETLRAQVDAAEKRMEEIRLAREVELKQLELLKPQNCTPTEQIAQPPQVINVQTPPINVNVEASKPVRKRLVEMVDPVTGMSTFEMMPMPEEPGI